MVETRKGLSLTDSVIAQLRIEKAKLIANTGQFWNYDQVIEALIAHWQLRPPAALPKPGEVEHNYEIFEPLPA